MARTRVDALARQAAAEFRLFLATVAAVVFLCWGAAYLLRTVPVWLGKPVTPAMYRSTRKQGSDYFLRNVELRSAARQGGLSLNAILSYAVERPEDVARVFQAAVSREGGACPAVGVPAFSDTIQQTSACLIAAVVDTREPPYSLWLVDFRESKTPVLRVLREELAIAPPAGHAVVRVFEPGDPIPEPLRAFHQGAPQIAGASFGGPYIAIFNADAGIDAVLGHELVHAYLATVMGRESARLPSWFHEGVALSLARTPMAATQSADGDLRYTVLTAQYMEYKRVFDRLEMRLGRARYLGVLRDCVAQRSEAPLLAAARSRDYAELRHFANQWLFADIRPYLWMLGAGIAIALANFVRRRRASRAVRPAAVTHPEQAPE